ncbi:hypothetical protein Tco_1161077 [Tanacetum coccineum]
MEVSGGPFGIEDNVRGAGPFLALIGFLVFAVIWNVPEALITAEMGTMFPEDGGYVIWVVLAVSTRLDEMARTKVKDEVSRFLALSAFKVMGLSVFAIVIGLVLRPFLKYVEKKRWAKFSTSADLPDLHNAHETNKSLVR